MTNDSGYHIERLTSENLFNLNRLFSAVYGKESALNYFEKKYDTAYTGVSFVGYIAYDTKGTPAGFYGVIPCFLDYNKTKTLIAQSADTMTHPDHRQKGLFALLMQKTIELCRKEGIQLLYGFPNQNSLNGFRKANWQADEYLNCFVIKTKGFLPAKLLKRLLLFKSVYSSYVSRLLKPITMDKAGLPNLSANEGFDVIMRDDRYLKYKTYSQTEVIRVGSAFIWIKIQNGIIIGDMIVDENNFDATIKKLKNLAYRLGLNQLIFQSNPGTKLHNLFAARYSFFPSFATIFYPISTEINTENIKFTFADIDIF